MLVSLCIAAGCREGPCATAIRFGTDSLQSPSQEEDPRQCCGGTEKRCGLNVFRVLMTVCSMLVLCRDVFMGARAVCTCACMATRLTRWTAWGRAPSRQATLPALSVRPVQPPPLPTAMQSFASQLAPQRRHTPPTQAPASASPVRRGSPPHGRPSIACNLSNTSVLVAACWHGTARLPATGRYSCIFQLAASRCKYWRRLTKCARGLTCWACVRECAQPLQPRPRSPIASCIP